jgi:hypothetical protein
MRKRARLMTAASKASAQGNAVAAEDARSRAVRDLRPAGAVGSLLSAPPGTAERDQPAVQPKAAAAQSKRMTADMVTLVWTLGKTIAIVGVSIAGIGIGLMLWSFRA